MKDHIPSFSCLHICLYLLFFGLPILQQFPLVGLSSPRLLFVMVLSFFFFFSFFPWMCVVGGALVGVTSL